MYRCTSTITSREEGSIPQRFAGPSIYLSRSIAQSFTRLRRISPSPMRSRWRELVMAVGALAWGRPGSAQVIRELGVQAIGSFSYPGLVVSGGFGALSTSGLTRLSLGLGAGSSDGEVVARGDLLGHFL